MARFKVLLESNYMITHKVLLIAAVALTGLLFAPSAQARDLSHHHGHRHGDWRGGGGGYYAPSYYGYNQPYYYDQGPVVYGSPYYGAPIFGATFAFGGHRGHHHHR